MFSDHLTISEPKFFLQVFVFVFAMENIFLFLWFTHLVGSLGEHASWAAGNNSTCCRKADISSDREL